MTSEPKPPIAVPTGAMEVRAVTYSPLGESGEITLSVGQVREFLAVRTKSGKTPSDADVVKFMMLCRARQLNPWVGDAYLIGYDGSDGPTFSLITSFQALLKRAEMCVHYNGLEGGIVVMNRVTNEPYNREGEILLDGETLLGGWARAYRSDQVIAHFASINLRAYDKKRSQWMSDPAGMISKCARAKALREAFPSQCGGLYLEGEVQSESVPQPSRVKRLRKLAEAIDVEPAAAVDDAAPEPQTVTEIVA